MPRFAAMARTRAVIFGAAAGDGAEVSLDRRQPAWPHRPAQLILDDAEMAEHVVSDAIVAECVLRCGGPWKRCGLPAGDLCLLAMHGARRSAEHGSPAPLVGIPGVSPYSSIQTCGAARNDVRV